jgi:hypothetical protein
MKEEIEKKDKINDIILNKSNKPFLFLIKIYILITILLIVLITIFSVYKIISTINFNSKFNYFFSDFSAITNRYSILFNFFNVFRTLLIFPQDKRKIHLESLMENMVKYYEEQNNKFLNILSNNMASYKEIFQLFNVITKTKNSPTNMIKEIFCANQKDCLQYLNSRKSIFDSGVDLAYKSCILQIHNLYLNYKQLINNTNIDEINSTIINGHNSEFILIGLSLSNTFYYVKEKIFECFWIDMTNFKYSYDSNISILNIISIIFSILFFLFVVIIIFLNIPSYGKPIKESSYRINCSFTFIKMHSLTNYEKSNLAS